MGIGISAVRPEGGIGRREGAGWPGHRPGVRGAGVAGGVSVPLCVSPGTGGANRCWPEGLASVSGGPRSIPEVRSRSWRWWNETFLYYLFFSPLFRRPRGTVGFHHPHQGCGAHLWVGESRPAARENVCWERRGCLVMLHFLACGISAPALPAPNPHPTPTPPTHPPREGAPEVMAFGGPAAGGGGAGGRRPAGRGEAGPDGGGGAG